MPRRKLYDREAILWALQFGCTQREIAKAWGITPARLCQVIRGRPGHPPGILPRVKKWRRPFEYRGDSR